MVVRLACAVLVAQVALGCGDDIEPEPLLAELAGFEVEVSSHPPRLTIRAEGQVLYDGLPGGSVDADADAPHVAWATRTGRAEIETLYGSFKIEESKQVEPWTGVTSLRNLRQEGRTIHFDLIAGTEVIGSARIAAAGDRQLSIDLSVADDRNRLSAAFACDPNEHFIGFGGQTFDVDQRGQTVPLWVQEQGIGKVEIDEYIGIWFLEGRRHSTHTPMPIYLSSRGYAMALDTSHYSRFAMCSEADDVARIEVWDGSMSLQLFYGPSPAEMIERLTGWTGRPELPPAFAFAPWLDAIFGEDNVRRVADKLRAEDIAVSVIWSEDWRGGTETGQSYVLDEDWEVDRDQYPTFESLADELHDDGYKFFIYHNTFLDSTTEVYQEAVAGDYTIKNDQGDVYLFDGVKFEPTTMLDLSNPAAVEFGKTKYLASLELGADGYMADYAEWLPHDSVLYSGEDAMAVHNLYPVEFQKFNREVLAAMNDGVERLFFVRSAWLGSQPLVSVVWAGDQQTDWSIGDGYPSIIPMGIGLGVTGFPYFGHDIGGYQSQGTEPTSKELWFRWVSFGALSPVMRTHHGRSAYANWNWESDDDSIAHMRRWTRLHMQLFPYLYELATRAAATGAPMFRPMAFDYPAFDTGWTSTDQYMLGDRIVVAPIIEQGATSRSVSLPPGTFYPLLGGAPVSGDISAQADMGEIPAYVPAGTILVLLPAEVDTLVDVAATSTAITGDSVGDDRELWLYPGGVSSWSEDGGRLGYRWSADSMTALPTSATYDGQAVELTLDGDRVRAQLTGPGTLAFPDGSELVIEGGAADRAIDLVLHEP